MKLRDLAADACPILPPGVRRVERHSRLTLCRFFASPNCLSLVIHQAAAF